MARTRRPYVGGLILITLGILFLLDNMGIANFGDIISTYWPVIIILIGFSMLVRRNHSHKPWNEAAQQAVFSDTTSDLHLDYLNNSSVFGDLDIHVESNNFKGGIVSTTFGDMNIDLSKVELAEGEQLLRLDGVFGDMHVLVPKNIPVTVTAKAVFGDVRVLGTTKQGIGQEVLYTSPEFAASNKKLRISTHQVFGDVRVW